ncbi:hypothetical protein PIB30_093073 [Stylosanthes scabra]|uniref:Uncharacterized protein n=1 Tax=Stylosanthes scabra TaxID=79078 RepID=A0ABU6RWE3_9FABA|nr:hypothetical protein [Stylosanthes scabra]
MGGIQAGNSGQSQGTKKLEYNSPNEALLKVFLRVPKIQGSSPFPKLKPRNYVVILWYIRYLVTELLGYQGSSIFQKVSFRDGATGEVVRVWLGAIGIKMELLPLVVCIIDGIP